MFGYIKKEKVLSIIDKGEVQLTTCLIEVMELNDKDYNTKQLQEIRDSIKKIEGGLHTLESLRKHFT